jgi:D-beta-D-heptose 7-phosphate kinase/D-beta-D-heptose 1-phosphate adenosyltransferase
LNLDSIELFKKKTKNQKVVFTNGCFDILHVGHLRYLHEAKKLGDVLVVGLNSDASVKRLKGTQRPICDQVERSEMLLGLKPVDYVFLFEEDTPQKLIEIIRPQILCKGGDWQKSQIAGSAFVEAYGGKVLSLNFEVGHSTTEIIDRILKTDKK